jgi:hypothetical protein
MSPRITLFELQIADASTGWVMTLSGGRNLDNRAAPFFLETDPLDWPMTLREASFVSFAAKRVLRRLGLAAEGRQFKLGPSFKKALEVVDDAEPLVVEFGLRKDGPNENDPPRVYLRIGSVLIGCSDADGYRLLGAFCRYDEADKLGPPQPVQGSIIESMRDPELALPDFARDELWDAQGRRK